MKKLLFLGAAISALGMYAGSAMAASSDSAEATVVAIIVEPTIAVKNTAPMTFGSFGSNSKGEVKTGDASDDTVIFSSTSSKPTAATFEMTGDDNFAFGINLSNPGTLVGSANGGVDDDLRLNVVGETTDLTTSKGVYSFDVNGILDLGNKGALNVGKLVSSFTATVVYQ